MEGSDFEQRRRRFFAASKSLWTAGFESASGSLDRFYRIAFDKPKVFDPHSARIGDRESPVAAPRYRDDAASRQTESDDPISTILPKIHHRDPVADALDDPEIVGDENI